MSPTDPQGATSPRRDASGVGKRGRDGDPVVPPASPDSYYGKPVIASPVWTWEIPTYFLVGGMAGACAPIAAGARLAGDEALAKRAAALALAGATVSPVLLVSDLGRPSRFLNMLRVFKPTSPMSVGSWILASFGPSAALAAGWQLAGVPGRRVGIPAQVAAAGLGPLLSTYTAVLIANTAVPVWHDARRTLPFVFAASSAASAGGALTALGDSRAARTLAIGGAVAELAVTQVMERRLDPRVRASYEAPGVEPLHRAAQACNAAGAALLVLRGRRSRLAAVAGGLAACAGAALSRWSIFKAGTASAEDPEQTVGPQRERLDGRAPVTRSGPAAHDPAAPGAPVPGADGTAPDAAGPGRPPAQDDPIAPRRGA